MAGSGVSGLKNGVVGEALTDDGKRVLAGGNMAGAPAALGGGFDVVVAIVEEKDVPACYVDMFFDMFVNGGFGFAPADQVAGETVIESVQGQGVGVCLGGAVVHESPVPCAGVGEAGDLKAVAVD